MSNYINRMSDKVVSGQADRLVLDITEPAIASLKGSDVLLEELAKAIDDFGDGNLYNLGDGSVGG